MAFGPRFGACRLGGRGVAGDEAQALAAGVEAVALEDAQTPLWESRMPPHWGRASSAAMRAGPKPGWPRAKATTPCSTSGLVALGMRGCGSSSP